MFLLDPIGRTSNVGFVKLALGARLVERRRFPGDWHPAAVHLFPLARRQPQRGFKAAASLFEATFEVAASLEALVGYHVIVRSGLRRRGRARDARHECTAGSRVQQTPVPEIWEQLKQCVR